MILETIVSTLDLDGEPHFAPMGIAIEDGHVVLRPFRTATTWRNLRDTGQGVVHFTDDALLFARCAVGSFRPPSHEAATVRGRILDDACSWKEFVVTGSDLAAERGRFTGRVVGEGRGTREFLGFNRARHAVIEATILVTRLHLLGRDRVLEEIFRLRPLIDKTAGAAEREAYDFLIERARRWDGDAH